MCISNAKFRFELTISWLCTFPSSRPHSGHHNSFSHVIFTPYTLKISLKPLLFSHNTSYFLETAQFATEQQSLQVRRDSDSLSSAAVKDGQHKHAFVNSPTCASDLFRCFFALNEPLSELLRICHNERKSQRVIYSFSLNCAEVFA